MKINKKWYIAVGLAMALVTTFALARGIGGRQRGGMGLAAFSPLRVAAFLQDLDLTAQQRDQIKSILALHKEEIKANADSIVRTRLALHDALRANSQLEPAFAEAFAAEKKALLLRQRIGSEVSKVLNPVQKAMIAEKRGKVEEYLQEGLARLGKFLDHLGQ